MAGYNYTNPYMSTLYPYVTQAPAGVPSQSYQFQAPVQQQQSQQTNQIITFFVESEEPVNNYPVAPGVTAVFISFKLGKFFIKTTGMNGVPDPLRVCTFHEEKTLTENQNAGNYATKEEMMTLSDKLDKLIASLGGDK